MKSNQKLNFKLSNFHFSAKFKKGKINKIIRKKRRKKKPLEEAKHGKNYDINNFTSPSFLKNQHAREIQNFL